MASKRGVIHVASVCQGLVHIIKHSLPGTIVKDIALNEKGELTKDGKAELLENAEIILGDLTCISDVIYNCKNLKWAHSTWAGVDYIMKRINIKEPPGIILTRTGDAFKALMAEYVLGYIIATERGFLNLALDQTAKDWHPGKYREFRTLGELRLGVLGAGNIGHGIGRLCKSVGMEVWGLHRSSKPVKMDYSFAFDQYRNLNEMDDFLVNCDYICSVLPATNDTDNLLSGNVLEKCSKKKPVFINVGRGNVIDESSIIRALENNWIKKAVLDVFSEEPLSKESALWSHPRVVITPHVSGPSRANEVAKPFVSNYKKFVQNEQLDFVVNWSEGY